MNRSNEGRADLRVHPDKPAARDVWISPGEQLARMRHTVGLTQKQLAERIGVRWSTVSGWEIDSSQPCERNLTKIAQTLGCAADEIPWKVGADKPARRKAPNREREVDAEEAAYVPPVRREYLYKREWLMNARRNKGLKCLDVAIAANISKPYYRLVELGERTPPEAVAKAIGRVVGVDYRKILEEERCKP